MPVTIDKTWTGASDLLWTTAGNWNPSGAPGAGNDVQIPSGTTGPISMTGMSDLALGVCRVDKGYLHDLGTSGTRLISSFTSFVHEGAGKLWFGAGAGTTARIIIANSQRGLVDAADIGGSNITELICLRGLVRVASSGGTLTRLEVGYITDRLGDVRLILDDNANAVTTLEQRGGFVDSTRVITGLLQNAGTLWQNVGRAITTADIAGNVWYKSNSTITTCRVAETGVFDAATGRTANLTITTLRLMPGAMFVDDRDMITITNDVQDFRRLGIRAA
jgi:hypothetical protein